MTSTKQRVPHPDEDRKELKRRYDGITARREITRALIEYYERRVEAAAHDPIDADVDILTGGTYA